MEGLVWGGRSAAYARESHPGNEQDVRAYSPSPPSEWGFPHGRAEKPENRRYNHTLREPTAGLLGRCFDDRMIGDDGYQAPTAPMEFVACFRRSHGPLCRHTEST